MFKEEKYLIVNAGSSSLKFTLYTMPGEKEVISGIAERIGTLSSSYTLKFDNKKIEEKVFMSNHSEALKIVLNELINNHLIESLDEIKAVGHRILHGGEYYCDSVIIDKEVKENIRRLTPLGPLHHPGELLGISAIEDAIPGVTQVAVFDTAFHQTLPEENYMYPVPLEWYREYAVRKYGFHGTSHKYITNEMKRILNKENVNLIICHIGSGCSITCIKDGKSYNTTMGLTPLDGLMMCTRSGSIDPSIIEYISKCKNISIEEITEILNKRSGILGLTCVSDFRDVEKLINEGDKTALLSFKMVINSIKKYIADYYFELDGKVDAIVLTAGAGENQASLRSAIIDKISKPLNIYLDVNANENIGKRKAKQSGIITTKESSINVYVIPTNEEIMILNDTYKLTKEKDFQKIK